MTTTTTVKITLRHLGGAIILLTALSVASPSQDRDRSKIADQYKWDLTALYPTERQWRDQKQKLVAELPKLHEFRGALGSSAQRLAGALETRSPLDRELKRRHLYPHL